MAFALSKICPAVYVVSQIPQLHECVKKIAPEKALIKDVLLPEKFDRELHLSLEQIEALKDAEVILGDTTLIAKTYNSLPKLKWVQCTWAGVEPLLTAFEREKVVPSFIITRHGCPEFSSLMAEYVMCQILNWEKRMRLMWKNQNDKTWGRVDRFTTSRSLSEVVVAILGIGNMGCGVARHLKNWGTKTLGFSRTPREEKAMEYSFFNVISTDLEKVMSECDYLCNTLPNTAQTRGLLNGNTLSKCMKKPVFINVGRGSIIEEKYIIEAIKNSWISGAVLDVFEKEPLPESSELWSMPEVVITPHIAADSTAEHVAKAFITNYNHYVAGEMLEHVVDISAGY